MKQMILRLADDMWKCLKTEAAVRGQTLTGLIRQILWEWVKKNVGRRTPDGRPYGGSEEY